MALEPEPEPELDAEGNPVEPPKPEPEPEPELDADGNPIVAATIVASSDAHLDLRTSALYFILFTFEGTPHPSPLGGRGHRCRRRP